MNVIAHTMDGLGISRKIPITLISVWIFQKGCDHKISDESIKALMEEVKKSKQMQVYGDGQFKGQIDAFSSTPLYTNGQLNVWMLEVDNKIIWNLLKEI